MKQPRGSAYDETFLLELVEIRLSICESARFMCSVSWAKHARHELMSDRMNYGLKSRNEEGEAWERLVFRCAAQFMRLHGDS